VCHEDRRSTRRCVAARFFDRSEATKTFKRGIDAHNNPAFYRQLGKDRDLLLSAALELLALRAFEAATDKNANLTIPIDYIGPIAHQAPASA
jgi:hypothetical protein